MFQGTATLVRISAGMKIQKLEAQQTGILAQFVSRVENFAGHFFPSLPIQNAKATSVK